MTTTDLAPIDELSLHDSYVLCDDIPTLVSAAVHEAAHTVARIALGIPQGAVEIHPDGSGISHPAVVGQRASAQKLAIVCLAGPVAEAEFVARTISGGQEYRDLVGAARGAGDAADVDPQAGALSAEIIATALVRTHWAAVVRLATALVATPTLRLTAVECNTIVGNDVHRWDDAESYKVAADILDGELDSIAVSLGLAPSPFA